MKKHNSYKIISALLLFAFLFIAVMGVFSFTAPSSSETENTMRTMPFPTDIAAQVTGDSPMNMVRLRFAEWLGKSLGNRQLFDVWLQSQISMDVFYAFFYNYLIVFLTIVLFHLITILWKHVKDGNKRFFMC